MKKLILLFCCLILSSLTADAYQTKDADENTIDNESEYTTEDAQDKTVQQEAVKEAPDMIDQPPSAHWSDEDVGWGEENQDE